MGRAIAVSRRRGGSGWCVKESWWRPVIAVTGERRLKSCSYCTSNPDQMIINPLIPIVPKVDLPLRTDKCDFWNHFKTLIIWTLLLFCIFRLHKIVKRR